MYHLLSKPGSEVHSWMVLITISSQIPVLSVVCLLLCLNSKPKYNLTVNFGSLIVNISRILFGNSTVYMLYKLIKVYFFKWLLWELGWRIIMRCFSEWRTIPDKQRKIYLTRLGFEPATFGLLESVSKYQIAQVPSFDDQLPTWPVAQLVEHWTSKPKVAGSNPSRAK